MEIVNEVQWRALRPIIVECCAALFEAHGVAVTSKGDAADALLGERGVAAFIGFTGEQLLGSLVISLPLSVVQQAHPLDARLASDPLSDFLDWTAELANQLLGRIKNQLLQRGVQVSISTPVSLCGRDLRGPRSPEEGTRIIRFTTAESEIFVQFDARQREDLALLAAPADQTAAAPEGEFMLF